MAEAALPLVLLKASLLARMAERCQRHVMKEALHLLWKLPGLKEWVLCPVVISIDHSLKMGGLRVSKQRDSPWKNHEHLLMRRN